MDNCSLILVTYNRLKDLINVFNAIASYNWQYESFVIINNHSSDGTDEYLINNSSRISNLKVITLGDNIGHGAALAEGFTYLQNNTKSTYYILLEDDSIPDLNLLNSLFKTINGSSYDIISSYGMKVSLGKRRSVNPTLSYISEADFCLLDGAIINANIIKHIGLPVNDWFMMFDDFEYCYRIKKFGYKIGVIHNNFHQILHLGGGEKFSRSNLWRGYYQSRNHVLFLKKHFTFFNLLDFILIQTKRFYGGLLAPDRFKRTKFRLIGILHGIKNIKGRTLDPSTLKFNKTNF